MMPEAFSISRLPRIEFGSGSIKRLPELISRFGTRALIVTGAQSFQSSPRFRILEEELGKAGLSREYVSVSGEPSPQLVDDAVLRHADSGIEVIVGIGGGSALDAAKAIAGLLIVQDPIADYLEGVGPERPYKGPAVPFIAVPATAGTGSEATKNAVISVQGSDGFKKSFRDEQLVPEYALIDPDLLASCTPELIAANGMDALTQLMESFVSTRSSPMTDALALDGIETARDSLLALYKDPAGSTEGRAGMAYAALLSGICLAQTGLGSVHGLASPLGAFFPVPHGVVCGTLMATATRVNIEAMLEREPDNPAIERYFRLSELFCKQHFTNRKQALDALISRLDEWTRFMRLPALGDFGVSPHDIPGIVANSRGSSMKTNPIVLRDEEIAGIVQARLT